MAESIETQKAAAELLLGFQARMLKTPKDKRTAGWFKTNLSALEDQWRDFHANHLRLPRDASAKGDSYFLDETYDNVHSRYVDVKNMILNALQPGRGQSTVSADADYEEVTFESRQRTKLPTIDLSKFSGNQTEWESFKEMFLAVVHEVPSIAPVMKLQYLLASLTGETARRLSNTKIKAVNYQGAWETLINKYDNVRVNILAHLQSITSCPPVSRKSEVEINRVLTVILEAKRGLENLDCPVNQWDAWFVFHTVQKLDSNTREDWEMHLGDDVTMPKFEKLVKFLNTYARALETAHASDGAPKPHNSTASAKFTPKTKNPKVTQAHVAAAEPTDKAKRYKSRTCLCCQEQHNLSSCERYRSLSASQRRNFVSANNMCENCLKPRHAAADCRAPGRCFTCGGKHHTSLHVEEMQSTSTRMEVKQDSSQGAGANGAQLPSAVQICYTNPAAHAETIHQQVLLATALLELQNDKGEAVTVRALLDQGSEFSFLTEEVAQSLSLKRTKVDISVLGIGSVTPGSASALVTAHMKSFYNPEINMSFQALVMPKLTEHIPAERIRRTTWPHLQGLQMADPSYGTPGKIGCIIGAELYGQLLTGKMRRGASGEPVAQETVLGWIISGPAGATTATYFNQEIIHSHHVVAHAELHTALQAFWQVEEPPSPKLMTPDDELCQSIFTSTLQRDKDGRFIVRLPLKKPSPDFGDTRSVAVAQWLRTEAKLKRHPLQAKLYHDFLKEYKVLGHMEPISEKDLPATGKYYMPHHCLIKKKEDTNEFKVRVVFNASQPSTTGLALNHVLLPGPKLQGDIWSVLMLWRFWKFVFTADIVKMFRQILIDFIDTTLQLIIWREHPEAELQMFRLLTVTYGTSPAPYLANRVLIELAMQYVSKYPKGAKILRHNKYVDEFYAGGDTLDEANEAEEELVNLLGEGQFPLSKWSTNCPALLKVDAVDPATQEKTFKTEDCVWALGTAWLPSQDCFTIKVRPVKPDKSWTKRAVLSEIAKLFDPLGWLGPVVIRAKALMQDLCITAKSIQELEAVLLQLHAFSDASERAYSACVYIVAINRNERTSSLVIGKTKVAPIKTLSIPRLELCGAHLAARLVAGVKNELQDHHAELFCWTDSAVVISWLSSHPTRWNTFVATRSSAIAALLPETKWQHVPSKDNPADLASRGASPSELRDSALWWSGPVWLVHGNPPPAVAKVPPNEMSERRSTRGTTLVSQAIDEEYMLRFSSYSKLIRVTAYCLRFVQRCTSGKSQKKKEKKKSLAENLWLSSQEITLARNALIKFVQGAFFPTEIRALKAGSAIANTSRLVRLRPFLDEKGLLRIAGRLARSTLPYAEKHPIILPQTSILTKLFINYAHQRTLHGGVLLTLSYIMRAFWIIHAKTAVRSVLKNCVRCARFNSKPATQLMGSLPPFRVEEARPFLRSGVDYAGPIAIRTSKGRGHKSQKGYLCILVCLAVKAVHIEIASDLTTASFLAAYKRFTGRRGRCADLLSDNGTNFHGADGELRRLFHEASTLEGVGQYFANEATTWKYIPPGAPHFGGLWEAAVKSVKRHIRKVIGEATLTYEELSTLTIQVEACLNSRPLFVPSSDGRDAPPITPAHFLIGTALTAPPELYDENEGRLNPVNRWVLITKMRNQFWSSWRRDYLHTLQQRGKWYKPNVDIAIGDVVLLINENTPPTKWPLGRIIKIFPGHEGLTRVVEVKTANSTYERPLNKICKLPVLNEDSRPEEFSEI